MLPSPLTSPVQVLQGSPPPKSSSRKGSMSRALTPPSQFMSQGSQAETGQPQRAMLKD